MAKAYKCEICNNLFEGSGKIEDYKIVYSPKSNTTFPHPKLIIISIEYLKISKYDFDHSSFNSGTVTLDICKQCQIQLVESYLKQLKDS